MDAKAPPFPPTQTSGGRSIHFGAFGGEFCGVDAALSAFFEQIDLQVAHQPLDDRAAQEVVVGNHPPTTCGQAPGADALTPAGDRRVIWNIALGQVPDRRCSKADKQWRVVRRIALKIAMKS